jgi:hypothetical protein
MSCSALIGSAPSICARRRRERLAKTLAPVGPQAPPALRSARLVAVAALRAGPSCGLPGRAASVRQPVHYVSEHLSTISTVDTPAPIEGAGARFQALLVDGPMMGEGLGGGEHCGAI